MLSSEAVDRFRKDGFPGPTPSEQANRAIEFVGDKQSTTGERVEEFPQEFYAWIGAVSPTAAHEVLIELQKRGDIDGRERGTLESGARLGHARLTLQGWEKYELRKKGRLASKHGFLAMKFGDPALEDFVAKHLKPHLRSVLDYDLGDMRDSPEAGIIDNIMRSRIRDALFVIVDLTHDNSGAYWEAGYAEGLGKPVIYICEQNKFHEKK